MVNSFTCRLLALLQLLQAVHVVYYAAAAHASDGSVDMLDQYDAPAACDCDLENNLHAVNLLSRVREHSVPTSYTIDVRIICDRACVVFGKLPSTPDYVHQGNWSIDRSGTIRFEHRPHKTGVAMLNITVEEVLDSNYTAHTIYRVVIEEDPDWPIVFASQVGLAVDLGNYDNTTQQFKNVTFSVEQNTGNNTAYADLRFTAGSFDYDDDEAIRVAVLTLGERPRLGQIVGGPAAENSSTRLLAPLDCDLPDSGQRLRNRSLSAWDTELPRWHPCGLRLPYPAAELSWFTHLVRYRPGLQQAGLDRFALTYSDKYGLQAKLYVHVHILVNPCVNEGRCWGPIWDPNCTSHVRSSGFFNNGYLCQCETGWVGDRCEIDFDDCSSSPCPSPFVCVDKFRGFECTCPENLARCQPILKPWQLSATILGVVAGVCIVAAVLVLASQGTPIILKLSIVSPNQPEDPKVAAAEPTPEVAELESEGLDLPEPAMMQPVITVSDAGVQADEPEPSPTPPPTPPPRPPRPQNPAPAGTGDDRYRQSFHRGSILIPRQRPVSLLRSPAPLFEEAADESRRASVVAAGGDSGDEVVMRGGGAGSPSDAMRLRELRQAVRNRQTMDEF